MTHNSYGLCHLLFYDTISRCEKVYVCIRVTSLFILFNQQKSNLNVNFVFLSPSEIEKGKYVKIFITLTFRKGNIYAKVNSSNILVTFSFRPKIFSCRRASSLVTRH